MLSGAAEGQDGRRWQVVAIVWVAILLLQGPNDAIGTDITGELRMADGSPAGGVRVAAIAAPAPGIRPSEGQNYYAVQPAVRLTLTDAEGRYRLGEVPPGRYFIVAGLIGHATYYPSTADVDAAAAVTIEPGDPPRRLDFRLVNSPGARVGGRIEPPPSNTQERAVLSGTRLGELMETPVRADGTFEFGRVPRGDYLLNIFPTPPGMPVLNFRVGDEDVTALRLARPPVRTVRGRIDVDRGPLPQALLSFETPSTHQSASIAPDRTFVVQLHAGRHRAELAGMPIGYELRAVTVGGRDVTADGLDVHDADVSDVLITVSAPEALPSLRGRLRGAAAPLEYVELRGPIVGRIQTPVRADGTFEVTALPPGLYELRIPQLPAVGPIEVVVTSAGADVDVAIPRF